MRTPTYVHRGYAFLLQGKQDEATRGKQIELRLYLLGTQVQNKEPRWRRADWIKGINKSHTAGVRLS